MSRPNLQDVVMYADIGVVFTGAALTLDGLRWPRPPELDRACLEQALRLLRILKEGLGLTDKLNAAELVVRKMVEPARKLLEREKLEGAINALGTLVAGGELPRDDVDATTAFLRGLTSAYREPAQNWLMEQAAREGITI